MPLPETRLSGWVLELEIPGATGELFRALAAIAEVDALLEPVGLDWVLTEAPGQPGCRQVLRLRNLYLEP